MSRIGRANVLERRELPRDEQTFYFLLSLENLLTHGAWKDYKFEKRITIKIKRKHQVLEILQTGRKNIFCVSQGSQYLWEQDQREKKSQSMSRTVNGKTSP